MRNAVSGSTGRGLWRATGRASLVVMTVLCASCLDNPVPHNARLVIEGDAGKTVRVISSRQFVAQINEQGQTRVVILKSDTTFATLPYDKTYDIVSEQQFFAETSRNETQLQTLHMRVFVDANAKFDRSGALIDSPFRFVYWFNHPITQDISVSF
jgi:hypothetical protein